MFNNKNKVETSKKILIFVAFMFLLSITLSLATFVYCATACIECCYELLITIISIAGGAFSTSIGFYYNKSKAENIYKLKKDLLKDRYEYLKQFQVMTDEKADKELENALDDIESTLENLSIDSSDGI